MPGEGPAGGGGSVHVVDSVNLDGVQKVDRRRRPKKAGPGKFLAGLARVRAVKRARLLVEGGATVKEAARITGLGVGPLEDLCAAEGWVKARDTLAGVAAAQKPLTGAEVAKDAYTLRAVALGNGMLNGLETLDLGDKDTLLEAIGGFATLTRALNALLGVGGASGGPQVAMQVNFSGAGGWEGGAA